MIVVRPYRAQDEPAITRLHQAQGLAYTAPDWKKCEVSALIEVDGQIQMAAFLRKTAETYLLMDPTAQVRKRERLGQLLILHKEMIPAAQRAGLQDVHCWLPPQLEPRFGRLLLHMGWTKPLWPCYSREVE